MDVPFHNHTSSISPLPKVLTLKGDRAERLVVDHSVVGDNEREEDEGEEGAMQTDVEGDQECEVEDVEGLDDDNDDSRDKHSDLIVRSWWVMGGIPWHWLFYIMNINLISITSIPFLFWACSLFLKLTCFKF